MFVILPNSYMYIHRHRCVDVSSQKNNTDVELYNFDADQSILIIFGRDVAERICYQTVICYPTSLN